MEDTDDIDEKLKFAQAKLLFLKKKFGEKEKEADEVIIIDDSEDDNCDDDQLSFEPSIMSTRINANNEEIKFLFLHFAARFFQFKSHFYISKMK